MKTNDEIREQIRSDYATIATSNCCAGACGVTESIDAGDLAEQIGYRSVITDERSAWI